MMEGMEKDFDYLEGYRISRHSFEEKYDLIIL